jgi:hypothetical protein
MALPILTDTQMDALINARLTPLLAEIAQHQLNAISQGDELTAAQTADTAGSTVVTRARLRDAVAALKQTDANIATITAAAKALDNLASGTVNSAQRARNRANAAIAAAALVVVPAEPTP